MEELIESIRLAVVADASDDARRAGASACRTILLALDPTAGAPGASPNAAADPMPQIGPMLGALRGVPPDQLLDLAIAHLRAALPPDAAPVPVKPLKFHLVPAGGRR